MTHQLKSIVPKLPARDLNETRRFYVDKLGFKQWGPSYPDYLILYRDNIEIHFFVHRELDILENYGMCYIRVENIDAFFNEIKIHFPDSKPPAAKPWGQKEFYVCDNNNNGLSFGEQA
jgi:catechol 2,3-dioxygenase-like lactoylglutathione lyase family enzyme